MPVIALMRLEALCPSRHSAHREKLTSGAADEQRYDRLLAVKTERPKIDESAAKSKALDPKFHTGDLHDVGELSLKNHGSNPTKSS